jgi:hypothetical protein
MNVVRKTMQQDYGPSADITLFVIGDVKHLGCNVLKHEVILRVKSIKPVK